MNLMSQVPMEDEEDMQMAAPPEGEGGATPPPEGGADYSKILSSMKDLGGMGSSSGAVADMVYEAYTRKKSPMAEETARARAERTEKLRAYLENKRQERAMANEDADRKFQIARYLEEKKLQDARLVQDDDHFKQKLAFDQWKAQQDAAKGDAGSKITAGTAKEIGEIDAAMEMANQLDNDYQAKASAAGSSVSSYFPGTDANLYEKKRAVAAQTIGGILEGGKLTEQDYARYKSMLPSPTDTNEQARAKMDAIKQLIAAKKQGGVNALGQAGYNTSNISGAASIKPEATASARTIAKKMYSPSANKTKLIYSDGSEEVVDGQR